METAKSCCCGKEKPDSVVEKEIKSIQEFRRISHEQINELKNRAEKMFKDTTDYEKLAKQRRIMFDFICEKGLNKEILQRLEM